MTYVVTEELLGATTQSVIAGLITHCENSVAQKTQW
jgi:hypothetical protein